MPALEFARLTSSQLLALPRAQTVFFFAVSALEDHGPHLPLGTDLYEAQSLALRAGARLEAEMPGWHAVIMPPAPLGLDSNTQGLAITVRAHVLRDWLVDACDSLSRAGFFHYVCFTGQLGARQLTAIEEAGTLVRKRTRWIRLYRRFTGGARTASLAPLPTLVSACSAQVSVSTVSGSPLFLDAREHGGRRDTSVLLAIAPELVDPTYAQLPERAWISPSHWQRLWKRLRGEISGYWGKPAEASAAWGESTLRGSLDEIWPKLRAVFEGADPQLLFRTWYAYVPPNRTFFKSWLLAMLLTALLMIWMFANVASMINGQ